MDLLTPDQVFAGRYRIVRFLAKGGMGAVFVGQHIATEKRVAVKVLWPHVLGSADALQKFQLEAKVAGRVASDHIVSVLDAGCDDETKMPFLVMELLDGRTLEDLVQDRGPLSASEAVEYLRQVASGLDRAHGYTDESGRPAAIVHRDLKPENLFLTRRDDGTPLVKILDFGIAKVASQGTAMTKEVKGTPLYMAPEQVVASGITPRTDVWALGLIAFYLLTGRVYWRSAASEEGTMATLFGELLTLPLDPPSVRLSEAGALSLGGGFDGWFSRCVRREAAERFASAGEAIANLAAALDLPGFEGSTQTSEEGAGGAARSAVSATQGAVFAQTSVPVSRTLGSKSSPGTTSARPPRRMVWAGVAAAVVVAGGVALALAARTTRPANEVTSDDTTVPRSGAPSMPPSGASPGAQGAEPASPVASSATPAAAPVPAGAAQASASAAPPPQPITAAQAPSAGFSPKPTHGKGLAPRGAPPSPTHTQSPRSEDLYGER